MIQIKNLADLSYDVRYTFDLEEKNFVAFQILAEKYVGGELSDITKQIIPKSEQKRIEPVNKKINTSNKSGHENKLSKFDTRSSIPKQSNKISSPKINISRKNTKK